MLGVIAGVGSLVWKNLGGLANRRLPLKDIGIVVSLFPPLPTLPGWPDAKPSLLFTAKQTAVRPSDLSILATKPLLGLQA